MKQKQRRVTLSNFVENFTLFFSGAAAYGVGVKVENVDIGTLKEILAKPLPADVKAALELMLAASYNHLEAYSM